MDVIFLLGGIMNLETFKEKFRLYVSNYNMNDKAVLRKFYHSYRVMDLCMLIAQNSNFNDEDKEIAMLIGLLHDYARFEQWTKYKTYSDLNSVDHGDLAVKKLFDDKEIINFCSNEEYYDEIYDAIKYHNKLSIPSNLSNHNINMCKLVRDADKIDILYLFTINKELIEEDNSEISSAVIESFYKKESINYKDVKGLSDKILLDLAFVFDINYDYSFKYIKNQKLIEKIFENINNKEKFRVYFEFVIDYINERVK